MENYKEKILELVMKYVHLVKALHKLREQRYFQYCKKWTSMVIITINLIVFFYQLLACGHIVILR